MRPFQRVVLAVCLALLAPGVLAEEATPDDKDDSDWLIAQRAGRWELTARGAAGRVHKQYPNQEVLRLVGGGSYVEVLSMPAVAEGGETACSQRARRDAREPCSSSFLICRSDPANAAMTLAGWVFGAAGAAVDMRNRLACRPDVDAILEAAKDVGMIRRILPREEARQ